MYNEWCNYCFELYTLSNYCNLCVDKNNIKKLKRKDKRFIKCHYDNCNEKFICGNELYPFYCQSHPIDKFLVMYAGECNNKKCINILKYIDNKYCFYCDNHKTKTCKLYLYEGSLYTNYNNLRSTCNNCKK
jgi:hypothetical protein